MLPLCENHGLLAIVNDTRMGQVGASTTPQDQWQPITQAVLNDYNPYPAFAGLHTGDEPVPSQYAPIGTAVRLVRQLAPTKLVDNNLAGYFGGPDWGGVVQGFIDQVHPSYFSFDRYMLLMPDGYHNTPAQQATAESQFFTTLANSRLKSVANGVPFWCYLQGVAHHSGANYFRHPNYGETIWQINAALAYGARGLQWFTYWSPPAAPTSATRFSR